MAEVSRFYFLACCETFLEKSHETFESLRDFITLHTTEYWVSKSDLIRLYHTNFVIKDQKWPKICWNYQREGSSLRKLYRQPHVCKSFLKVDFLSYEINENHHFWDLLPKRPQGTKFQQNPKSGVSQRFHEIENLPGEGYVLLVIS